MAPQKSSGDLVPGSSPKSTSEESRKRKDKEEHKTSREKTPRSERRITASQQDTEIDDSQSPFKSKRLKPMKASTPLAGKIPHLEAGMAQHQGSPGTPAHLSQPSRYFGSPSIKPVAFAGFGETPKVERASGRVDAHKSRVPGEESSQGDHITSYSILERFVEHVCSEIHIETNFDELREKLQSVLTPNKIDEIAEEFKRLIDQDSEDHLTRVERKSLIADLEALPAVKKFLDHLPPSHKLPEKERGSVERLVKFVSQGKLKPLSTRMVKGEKKSAQKIAKNMKDFILTTINKTKMVAFFSESKLGEEEKLELSRKHKKEKEKTSRATQILIYADILFGNENITFGGDIDSGQRSRSQVFNKNIGLHKDLKDSDAFKQKIKSSEDKKELAKKIGLEIASNFMELFDFDAANNICKKNHGDDSAILKLVARHIAMCFNAFPNFTTKSTDPDFEKFRKTLPKIIFDSCIKIVVKKEKDKNKDILLNAIASATVKDSHSEEPEIQLMDTDLNLDNPNDEKKLIESLKHKLNSFIDPLNYSTILGGALYDGGKHTLPSLRPKVLDKKSLGLGLASERGKGPE